MTTVYTGASMSIDGYIAGPNEAGFEHLFQWYGNGDVEVTTGDPNMTLRMTHRDAPEGWEDKPFTFVTEGIERAIAVAAELAGGKGVGLNGGTIAGQALDAGRLDEVWVDLVPVLLGGGTPFFSSLGTVPVALDGPVKVTTGTNVTHMRYRVRR
jgi:hypothetical protein